MKILYLDCGMGAAGDMLAAALSELLPDPEAFVEELNRMGLPGVSVCRKTMVKCGVTGSHFSVTVNGTTEESLDYTDHFHHQNLHMCIHDCDHSHHDHHGSEHSHPHSHSHPLPHTHQGEHKHGQSHHHSGHLHHHTHEYDHVHRSLHDIQQIVWEHLSLPKRVKADIMAVYTLIAQAEGHVHGAAATEIHFHEVGTMDAIADIAAVCLLMHKLSPDQVVASPVHTGSGQVRCAHGILPVPAPAAAYILRDVPIYSGSISGELCTPTGAALLKHFVTRFGAMPVMRTKAIGYGMGKKDFPAANCLRAFLGETEPSAENTDTVLSLSCNIDDMTAEAIGFAMERLYDGGALEVYTLPIGMKKNRPATKLSVLCTPQTKETILSLLFLHTSTLGVRQQECRRYVLDRTITSLDTAYGTVRRKDASGYGVFRRKYEYDDLARIAKDRGLSIADTAALLDEELTPPKP